MHGPLNVKNLHLRKCYYCVRRDNFILYFILFYVFFNFTSRGMMSFHLEAFPLVWCLFLGLITEA
jgi:hypothetical protein